MFCQCKIIPKDLDKIALLQSSSEDDTFGIPSDKVVEHLKTTLLDNRFKQVTDYTIYPSYNKSIELVWEYENEKYHCIFFDDYVFLFMGSNDGEFLSIDSFFKHLPAFK